MRKRGEIEKKGIILLMITWFVFLLFFQLSSADLDLSEGDILAKWEEGLIEKEKSLLETYTQKYELRVLYELAELNYLELNQTSGFVDLIIYLKDISQAESLISNFSENEIGRVINRNISNRITAQMTEEAFFKLIQDERVESVYYNAPVQVLLEESASLINADNAWYNLGYNGTGVNVCVIDTGIDTNHPDLENNIVDEYCYCSDNCCPDNTNEDDSAEDDNGHGTEVSGVIVSQNFFDTGIAHGGGLYVVKAFDENSAGTLTDVGDAISWCKTQGVDVISLSLGEGPYYDEDCPSTIDIDINSAYNLDIVLVAASGNDAEENKIRYPACNGQVISVGATYDVGDGNIEVDWCDATGGVRVGPLCLGSTYNCIDYPEEDGFACWGNRNSNLDLLAPGFLVTTTALGGGMADAGAGTSLSTPMVSSAAALLLQKEPSLDPEDIRDTLQSTGVGVYDPESEMTFPRIDVEAALNDICVTGNWQAGSCGGGGCQADERYYTRTTDPNGCAIQTKCEYDVSCDGGGGEPNGIDGCDYKYENDNDCPEGYEATDHYCDWDVNNWECRLECHREEYCGSYGGEQDEASIFLNWDGSNYRGQSFYSPNAYFDDGYCWRFYGRSQFSVSDWGTANSYTLESETDEGGLESSCKISSSSTYSDIIYFGRGDNSNHRTRSEAWDYGNSQCTGGTPINDLEGSLTTYIYYASATYYPESYQYLYCDVPYAQDVDIDSVVYGDTDVECYVEVYGDDSDPEEIKIKWYVNGNYEGVDTCDGDGGDECDDSSGGTWSHTFDLSNVNYEKGDEVYCIGRGYGEDGGYGAYVESDTVIVSNRIPTWSSVSLNKNYAKQGNNIQITANSEDDVDDEALALYCCNGASCTPTTINHDFCYSIGDSPPYDSYCTGQGVSGDGTKTVRCRLYDGDDYSSIMSDTYIADNTGPVISETAVNITAAVLDEFTRVNCTATDSVGTDKFLIEADKPLSNNSNYSMNFLSGDTYYADIQLDEEGLWDFNCWVNDTLGNWANKTGINVTVLGEVSSIGVELITPENIGEIIEVDKNEFFNISVNVSCGPEADCGGIDVSFDPQPQERRTSTTDEICENGECTLTLYSGIRNVFEDERWKRVEDARSLKDKGFEIEFIEKDPEFDINVLDFNLTSITLELDTVEKHRSKNIPVKIWRKEVRVDIKDYKNTATKMREDSLEFSSGKRTETYEFGLDKILEFGFNSSTIVLQEPNTETLDDTFVVNLEPDNNFGSSFIIAISDWEGEINRGYLKFNSMLFENLNITSAEFQAYVDFEQGGNIQIHEVYDSSWDEGVITWNNQPCGINFNNSIACNLTYEDIIYPNQTDIFWSWNVTDMLFNSINNSRNLSVVLRTEYDGAFFDMYSKEVSNPSYRPRLVITYEAPIIKEGLISTIKGFSPFYTNESNPRIITLSANESQIVTAWVNATGEVGTNHTFFVYANITSNPEFSNISEKWNVSIVGFLNGLKIPQLDIIYTNSTQRVFRFIVNNTLTSQIPNISWTLNTGNGNKSSQYNTTLSGSEDLFVYVYHNYGAGGNYTVTARAQNQDYSVEKSIQITI